MADKTLKDFQKLSANHYKKYGSHCCSNCKHYQMLPDNICNYYSKLYRLKRRMSPDFVCDKWSPR